MIIGDLREQLVYRPLVADRIWRAWWEPSGATLADVEDALGAVIAAEDFPFTLVAHSGGRFVGTVTAIQSDIAARPDLGPCIAALWVEPEMRGQSVGQALVHVALERLAGLGRSEVYLAAKPPLHGYYADQGWTLRERGVGDDGLDVFARALA
jgi:predicted N-acetyltransferase YhbS